MGRIRLFLLAALGILVAGLLGTFVLRGKAASERISSSTPAMALVCGPCTSSLPPWQVVTPVPIPAVAAPAVASDGTYAYAIGGYSYQTGGPTTRVARFQPPTGAWQTLASVPDAHSESLAVYSPLNNKIYDFGGVDSVGTVLATTRAYDIGTNTWATVAPMPGVRRQMGGGYWNGFIYVAGGYSGPTVGSVQSTVFRYDVTTNSWATVASLPQPVGGPGYGMLTGKLYIAGGRDATTPNLNTLYEYDTVADFWQSRANLCQGVNAPGSAVVNNRLWVFGGGNPLLGTEPPGGLDVPATTNLLQVYDPPGNDWTTPNTLLNAARSSIGGTNVGNTAVAVGGYDGTTSVDTTEVNSGGVGSICGPTATPTNTQTATYSPTIPITPTLTPTLTATRTAFPFTAPTKTATPTPIGSPATPLPTPVSCYTYWITTGTGAIVPATTLVPGSNCDDCVVTLDVSGLGFDFPFYDLYGPALAGPPIMGSLELDSNGKTGLTNQGTVTPSPITTSLARGAKIDSGTPKAPGINVCLPASSNNYTIFPHWDDLRTDCTGCGIFTAITGTVGSRILDIEWRAEYYLCGGRVNVELRLYETTGDFEIIYGQVDQAGSLTTIGVQRDPGASTQYACNMPGSLTPGLLLHFSRQSCGAPTATATATVTGTPPTATSTRTSVVVCAPAPSATATQCPIEFTDVPPDHTFYEFIRCLACRGIISGYTTGCETGNPCFRPGNLVTRGQASKIVANAAGFSEPVGSQQFQDVPTGSTFFDFIWRLADRGIVSGYPCSGLGEPCIPPGNLPYFRPGNLVTRGQLAKIVSEAAGFSGIPGAQQFQDVPPGHTFYDYIWRLTDLGIMSGYPCGGIGEPCIPPGNLPYFRPGANATRGQASKIVANTFFPECETPRRP
jgi:N-acetylneuraminic acid mutarotase